MFNQRRKHSAYLEYNDGKIKSLEPNNKKEKIQKKINSHNKDSNITGKNLIFLLLFIIITVIFCIYSNYFIKTISLAMNEKNTNYKSSKKITEITSNINIKEKKRSNQISENMTLLISSINNYNSEITDIYKTLKGYISIYYMGKEGKYMTQKSLTAMIERINLDISILNSDESLSNQENLKTIYLNRFTNIKNYLNIQLTDKNQAIEDINSTILKENDLYKNTENEIKNILNKNNTLYQIKNNKIEIIN